MDNERSSERRITHNVAILTARMAVLAVVGLFTSRIVLKVLGVEDYGVYGVVAAITLFLAYLNVSMSGATSRFIAFEMGKGDRTRLRNTFSSAFFAHLGIGVVVLLLAETVGLWFLYCRLNIPPDRLHAAAVVYQFTVASAFVEITQVPYNATIIAHERMQVYAYVEMLNAALRLLSVWVLSVVAVDKLILYGLLTFCVNVVVLLVYRWYCTKTFEEAKIVCRVDRRLLMPILRYSLHDFYGNMCFVANQQGLVFLINVFFNVLYNAAVSLANTVGNVVSGVSSNVFQAFRPRIVKDYASGDIRAMSHHMIKAAMLSSYVYALIGVPCFVLAEDVLGLWLGQVPAHSVAFMRLSVLVGFVATSVNVGNVAIHATGDIKRISYINGTLYLVVTAATWIAFRYHMPAVVSYEVYAGVSVLIGVLTWWYIRLQIPAFMLKRYVVANLFAWASVVFAVCATINIVGNANSSFWRIVASVATTATVVCVSYGLWWCLTNKCEKR